MTLFLLDSDALIHRLNQHPPTVNMIIRLLGRGDEFALCDIVIAEVFAGLSLQERESASFMVESLRFLPSTPAVAKMAGAWRYDYARRGIVLPSTDTLVAATAVSYDATLISGNLRHYPMPELSLLPLPR